MQYEAQETYLKKKHTCQQYPVWCSRNTVQKTHRNTMQSWFYQSHLFEVLLCASWWAIVKVNPMLGVKYRMGGPQGPSGKVRKCFCQSVLIPGPSSKNKKIYGAQKNILKMPWPSKNLCRGLKMKKSIEALFLRFSHQRMKEALKHNRCFNKRHLVFRNNFNMANVILLLV